MLKDRKSWLIKFNYTMYNYKLLVLQMTLGRIWFPGSQKLNSLCDGSKSKKYTMKQRVSKFRLKCGKVLEA